VVRKVLAAFLVLLSFEFTGDFYRKVSILVQNLGNLSYLTASLFVFSFLILSLASAYYFVRSYFEGETKFSFASAFCLFSSVLTGMLGVESFPLFLLSFVLLR